jgi:orotate phosphoribosyltransferase
MNTNTAKRRKLVEIIAKTSFNQSPEPKFKLAFGPLSRFYIDCKQAFTYAEARALIGELILEKTAHLQFDAVGGLALGAVPIAIAVSDAAYRINGTTIKSFVVRKEPKAHGLGKCIEGAMRAGDRVLIVDDVITTGQSTINAIEKSREAGLQVIGVIALIDRQEFSGRENIEKTGVSFDALITLSDLEHAAERELISHR